MLLIYAIFTVVPQPCLQNCTCHRSPWDKVNIFDCRNKGLTSFPESVLNDTDWLLLSGNNLGSLNKVSDYLRNITLLNISSCNITDIDEKVMAVIIKDARGLDIRGNNLKILPKTITNATNVSKLWISENPYECCDVLWMTDWFQITSSVQDVKSVTCSNGKTQGKLKQNK